MILMLILAAACGGPPAGQADGGPNPDTADTGGGSYPSSFRHAKYRATAFALLPATEGLDLDADGQPDNTLPNLLPLVDAYTAQDMSLDGVNATLAAAIDQGELVLLLEADHDSGLLRTDVLLGGLDAGGALSVDPASFDDDGVPTGRLTGSFSSETAFSTSAARAEIPVKLQPDLPPVFIPLELALMQGQLDGSAASGILGGAIPVGELVAGLVEPAIPSGDAYDPADYNGMSREELLSLVTDLLSLETIATIQLDGGRTGVPAALSFEAQAADW